MSDGKTHFVGDVTLDYIAKLERQNAELLEALEESESVIRDACQAMEIYGERPPQIYLDALNKARAALAKVKGE